MTIEATKEVARDSAKPTVLVVDDSFVDRSLYVHMVRKWGYPVEVASDGEQAIEIITSQKIQLVLADWQMPGMMGTELCTRLRGLNLNHYTYLILMSAQSAEEFLIKALDAGADDVLTKPVDTNELEARLQSAVRRIELQARLAQQNTWLVQAYDLIAQDLRTVSKLQRSYLPEVVCEYKGVDYRWLSIPSQYVSGDHLNVFPLNDKTFGFYVLDVSGHGIPAAVKSMQLVQMFSDQSASSLVFNAPQSSHGTRSVARPRDVVARLNRLFQQTDSDLSYFTMIYGIFESETRKVTLCQAGHPNPLLLQANGEVKPIGNGGYPVGLFDVDDFEDIELTLGEKDALMLYSDGVTEVLNAQGDAYGEDRLLDFLSREIKAERTLELTSSLFHEVQQWGGKPVKEKGFEDDVSILMVAPQKDIVSPTGEQKVEDLVAEQAPSEQVFRIQEGITTTLEHEALAAESSGGSIVIVDDSRSFLRIFEAMLSSWGYTVHPAKNGDEAVKLIEEVQPDFVLTDWDMPGMSGIELCEQVRMTQHSSYIYIIMITGFASRDDLLRSLRVGADDFLTKPVNPSELKVRLKTAHRISNLHKDLEAKHLELSALYRSLQRDMREVSRIQRSLLPKGRTGSWPIITQTVYRPRRYVCGKQMGTLQTQDNEMGFFMLSLPGEGTSTALQVMAMARWFSMARATQVLFPVEEYSVKIRRYLAEPIAVRQQITELTPTIDSDMSDFDLLYGLINLDQGTLLVAGIGSWSMTIVEPGKEPKVLNTDPSRTRGVGDNKPMAILYRDVVAPGTRVFAMHDSSVHAMTLETDERWKELVLSKETEGCMLISDFSRLSTLSAQQNNLIEPEVEHQIPEQDLAAEDAVVGDDIAIMGFQWREFFPVRSFVPNDDELAAWQEEAVWLASVEETEEDSEPIVLDNLIEALGYEAVADTANIAILSDTVRELLHGHGFEEPLPYNVDLVLSEALTNVMNHGFKHAYPKPSMLILLVYSDKVVMMIRDHGTRIPQKVLDNIRNDMSYMDDLTLQDLPEGGMGLTFIRMMSKRFSYKAAYTVKEGYNQLAMIITS